MALNRRPHAEPAATMRAVASTDTAAPRSGGTGRVGALSALARPTTFRRGARLLSYVVLGALVGIALLVATATLPVLFGYHNYVVRGGSMGASLKAGSVAVTKPTSPYGLHVGDVIARRDSEGGPAVLHRIVDITEEDGQLLFTTQGDVNRTPDAQPVALKGPGDRVVYTVPYAGYVLDFASTVPGRLLLIGAPLALLAAIVLRERRRPPRPGRRAEETGPLSAAPPGGEEEAPRQAAAVLTEPTGPWRRAALVLALLPLALALGLTLADPRGWAGTGRADKS